MFDLTSITSVTMPSFQLLAEIDDLLEIMRTADSLVKQLSAPLYWRSIVDDRVAEILSEADEPLDPEFLRQLEKVRDRVRESVRPSTLFVSVDTMVGRLTAESEPDRLLIRNASALKDSLERLHQDYEGFLSSGFELSATFRLLRAAAQLHYTLELLRQTLHPIRKALSYDVVPEEGEQILSLYLQSPSTLQNIQRQLSALVLHHGWSDG